MEEIYFEIQYQMRKVPFTVMIRKLQNLYKEVQGRDWSDGGPLTQQRVRLARGGLSAGETGNDLGVVPAKGEALAEGPCEHLLDSIRMGRRKNTKDGTEIDIASLAMFCPYSRNYRRVANNMLQRGLVRWLPT